MKIFIYEKFLKKMKNILKFTSINSFDFDNKNKINEFKVEAITLMNQNKNLLNMIFKE
jgi:hypothetical protein